MNDRQRSTAMARQQGFSRIYKHDIDPWRYESSWYEARKRSITLACLPAPSYERCFEPGCSTGALTLALVKRCESVLAVDTVESVVEMTRQRTAEHPGVTVLEMDVPAVWPDSQFDLIVVSELGYYLESAELDTLYDRCEQSLAPGGNLVAVHWKGDAEDFRLAGGASEVHARLLARSSWRQVVHHDDQAFVADVVART